MSCTSIAGGIRPRKVDAKELIARAGESGAPAQKPPGVGRILDSSRLADVFGIAFGGADPKPSHIPPPRKGSRWLLVRISPLNASASSRHARNRGTRR